MYSTKYVFLLYFYRQRIILDSNFLRNVNAWAALNLPSTKENPYIYINQYLDLDVKRVTFETFYEELKENIKVPSKEYDDTNTVKYETLNKLKHQIDSIKEFQPVSLIIPVEQFLSRAPGKICVQKQVQHQILYLKNLPFMPHKNSSPLFQERTVFLRYF